MNINWKNILKKVGLWFIELVTVFIGVYLAFFLNGHRIQQNHEHKRQQIYTALYRYFSAGAPEIKRSKNDIDSLYVSPFLKAYQNKDMPRLKELPFFKSSINDHTWNAMLQAGGIDLLDIKLIREVSSFFAANQRLMQAMKHFNRLNETSLLPHLNDDLSEFYNTKMKKLKPKYKWYIQSLKKQLQILNGMYIISNRILKTLKQKMNKKQLQKINKNSRQ
jgi:hypothetical protein